MSRCCLRTARCPGCTRSAPPTQRHALSQAGVSIPLVVTCVQECCAARSRQQIKGKKQPQRPLGPASSHQDALGALVKWLEVKQGCFAATRLSAAVPPPPYLSHSTPRTAPPERPVATYSTPAVHAASQGVRCEERNTIKGSGSLREPSARSGCCKGCGGGET